MKFQCGYPQRGAPNYVCEANTAILDRYFAIFHKCCKDVGISGGDVSIAGNRLRTISGKTPHILHRPVESYANSRRVFDQKDIKS